jgi:hypothetical protein
MEEGVQKEKMSEKKRHVKNFIKKYNKKKDYFVSCCAASWYAVVKSLILMSESEPQKTSDSSLFFSVELN